MRAPSYTKVSSRRRATRWSSCWLISRRGLKPEILVDMGDPAEVILATGLKLQADLVVMATHGRTGLARIVMGSVTDKIVRGSHVPVLTLLPPVHHTHSN